MENHARYQNFSAIKKYIYALILPISDKKSQWRPHTKVMDILSANRSSKKNHPLDLFNERLNLLDSSFKILIPLHQLVFKLL